MLTLLIPGVSADVVTEEWVATPYASSVTCSDMSKSGDVVIFGYTNGRLVQYNSAGDKSWDVLPFGDTAITEILYPPEQTSFVYVRAGTTIKQISIEDGAVLWTATISGLSDFDTTMSGDIVTIVNSTTIETRNSAGVIVGSRVVDRDSSGITGTYSQVVTDPDGEWVAAINPTSDGKMFLYQYIDHSAANWLSGYNYRREHRIVGSTEGYLENYGINMTVYRTTGTTTGNKIYVGSNCRADYNDIRFVNKATGEVLQHAKTGEVTNGMGFTVKVPYLGKNANYDIYVYYGNSAATTDVSSWNGIVYEDIGWIDPSSVITNPSFETSSGWTTTSSVTSHMSTSTTLPSTEWKTHGSASIKNNLWGSGNSETQSSGNAQSGSASTTNTIAFPGINGSFKAQVYFDAYGYMTSTMSASSQYYPNGYATIGLSSPGGTSVTAVSLAVHNSAVGGDLNHPTDSTTATDVTFVAAPGTIVVKTTAVIRWDRPGGFNVNLKGYLDNLRFMRIITYPPTHSTWGTVQQNYQRDLDLKQTTTIGSTILYSDMAWSGDAFALTTSSRVYQVVVTGSTNWATTYATVSGTPYALKTTSGDNYVIEGRGTYMYLYRYTPTLDAAFSFGNTVDCVDIAEVTGDWAIVGSNDGTLKVFSKINSTEWYFAWSTTPENDASTVVFSERGGFFAYGTESGGVHFYSTTASTIIVPDIYTTIHIYRDGMPYSAAFVDVLYGSEYGNAFVAQETNKRTDSDGEFVLFGITGHYYQIDVKGAAGTVIGTKIIQISRTDYDKNIYIYVGITPYDEQISNKLDYGATYNESTDQIEMHYLDPDLLTDEVSFRILEISPTNVYTEVYSNTWYTSSVYDTHTVNPNNSYRVDVLFERENQEYSETFICTPIGRWHIEFPIPAEVRVGCFAILLICILALFPPDYRGVGAVTGMGFNTYFYAIGALPNPWWLLAVGWIAAIFYLFGRVQDGGL